MSDVPARDQDQQPVKSAPRLYTTAEVAMLTGRKAVSIKMLARRRHMEGQPLGEKVGRQWLFSEDEIREVAGIPNRRGRPGKDKKPIGDIDSSKLPR